MAKEGPVVIVGRTASDLSAAAISSAVAGGVAACLPGDVRDPSTATRCMELMRERGWHPANLVCNAGFGKAGDSHDFDMSLWREMFEVNVEGTMHFIRSVLPPMVETGKGTICIISSIAGLKGYARTAAYSASKHALVGLARSLAQEYGARGIVTVPLCPGYVEGEMTTRSIRGLMERKGISENDARERIERTSPQHRIMPPEEVAEAVAFVCSGSVPALNGNPLVLSGGE
jgi:NAD(P)-dependent dehydrogenase (short-subunit alcohol dehydrogenase family)